MNRRTMAILSYLFYFGIVCVIGFVIYLIASSVDKSVNKKPVEEEEVVVHPQIEVNRKNVSLKVGESTKVNIRLVDAENSDLVFESSNSGVATIDSTGMISAVGVGTATLKISVTEEVFVEIPVTVEDNNVMATGVVLTDTNLTKRVGDTYQIVAAIIPRNASNQAIGYKSDDPEVAVVNEAGLISFIAAGTCRITVYSLANPNALNYIDVVVR